MQRQRQKEKAFAFSNETNSQVSHSLNNNNAKDSQLPNVSDDMTQLSSNFLNLFGNANNAKNSQATNLLGNKPDVSSKALNLFNDSTTLLSSASNLFGDGGMLNSQASNLFSNITEVTPQASGLFGSFSLFDKNLSSKAVPENLNENMQKINELVAGISESDFQRLEPEVYLNDILINFYLK